MFFESKAQKWFTKRIVFFPNDEFVRHINIRLILREFFGPIGYFRYISRTNYGLNKLNMGHKTRFFPNGVWRAVRPENDFVRLILRVFFGPT